MLFEIVDKERLVDNPYLTSLIKAEWNVVRNNYQPIDHDPDIPEATFSPRCCGILFFGNNAVASNGHWLMHALTEGPSIDYNVSKYFYDYATDDVFENVNPFHREGISIQNMLDVAFGPEGSRKICVSPRDIVDMIEQLAPSIKTRRTASFTASPIIGEALIEVVIKSKKSLVRDFLRVPEPVKYQQDTWTVNCSYIHKIAGVFSSFTDSVLIDFAGGTGDPVIMRGGGLTFSIGQYFVKT